MSPRIIEVQLPPPLDPERRAWARLVTRVHPDQGGIHMYEGQPLKRGKLAYLDPGAVVLLLDELAGRVPRVSLRRADPVGGLQELGVAEGDHWAADLQRAVSAALDQASVDEDPIRDTAEWLDELSRRIATKEDRLRTRHPEVGERVLDQFTRLRVLCGSLGRELRQGPPRTRQAEKRRPARAAEPVVVTQGFDQREPTEQPTNPLREPDF